MTVTEFAAEFGSSFDAADRLIVTRIYAASEPELPGVDSNLIVDAVIGHNPERPEVSYVPELADVPGHLLPQTRSGDIILTLGAGNIWTIGDEILTRL